VFAKEMDEQESKREGISLQVGWALKVDFNLFLQLKKLRGH